MTCCDASDETNCSSITLEDLDACLDPCRVSSNLDHPENLEDGEDAHQPLDVCETPLLLLLLHRHLLARPLKISWQLGLVF